MNIRKGFTLVEILVVIVIIPFAAFALDRLLMALLTDIPRTSAVVQVNTTLLDMLKQLRKDIDKATGLPKSFAGHIESDELLLIEWPDSLICYQLKDGRVIRSKLTDTQKNGSEDARVWSVPNTTVQWRVWRKNGEGYAVEVETHVKQKLRAKWQKKMANSHLYFVGLLERL